VPIYDYKCLECNNIDERYVLSYRAENPNCSKCNNTTERQLPKNTHIDMFGMTMAKESVKAEMGSVGGKLV